MAANTVSRYGNLLKVVFSDGLIVLAHPSSGNYYLVKDNWWGLDSISIHGDLMFLSYNGSDVNVKGVGYKVSSDLWIISGNTSVGGGTGGGSGTTGAWIKPIVGYPIVSGFGPRASPGGIGSTFHRGVDFSGGGVTGKPILACSAGTIYRRGVSTGAFTGFGNTITILHTTGETSLYGHMIAPPPNAIGDTVSAGDVIGNVGTTGASTGAHLHFQVAENTGSPLVDPVPFMAARGVTL